MGEEISLRILAERLMAALVSLRPRRLVNARARDISAGFELVEIGESIDVVWDKVK